VSPAAPRPLRLARPSSVPRWPAVVCRPPPVPAGRLFVCSRWSGFGFGLFPLRTPLAVLSLFLGGARRALPAFPLGSTHPSARRPDSFVVPPLPPRTQPSPRSPVLPSSARVPPAPRACPSRAPFRGSRSSRVPPTRGLGRPGSPAVFSRPSTAVARPCTRLASPRVPASGGVVAESVLGFRGHRTFDSGFLARLARRTVASVCARRGPAGFLPGTSFPSDSPGRVWSWSTPDSHCCWRFMFPPFSARLRSCSSRIVAGVALRRFWPARGLIACLRRVSRAAFVWPPGGGAAPRRIGPSAPVLPQQRGPRPRRRRLPSQLPPPLVPCPLRRSAAGAADRALALASNRCGGALRAPPLASGALRPVAYSPFSATAFLTHVRPFAVGVAADALCRRCFTVPASPAALLSRSPGPSIAPLRAPHAAPAALGTAFLHGLRGARRRARSDALFGRFCSPGTPLACGRLCIARGAPCRAPRGRRCTSWALGLRGPHVPVRPSVRRLRGRCGLGFDPVHRSGRGAARHAARRYCRLLFGRLVSSSVAAPGSPAYALPVRSRAPVARRLRRRPGARRPRRPRFRPRRRCAACSARRSVRFRAVAGRAGPPPLAIPVGVASSRPPCFSACSLCCSIRWVPRRLLSALTFSARRGFLLGGGGRRSRCPLGCAAGFRVLGRRLRLAPQPAALSCPSTSVPRLLGWLGVAGLLVSFRRRRSPAVGSSPLPGWVFLWFTLRSRSDGRSLPCFRARRASCAC